MEDESVKHFYQLVQESRWDEARETFRKHRDTIAALPPLQKALILPYLYGTDEKYRDREWGVEEFLFNEMLLLGAPVSLDRMMVAYNPACLDPLMLAFNGDTRSPKVNDRSNERKIRVLLKLKEQIRRYGYTHPPNVLSYGPLTDDIFHSYRGCFWLLNKKTLSETQSRLLTLMVQVFRFNPNVASEHYTFNDPIEGLRADVIEAVSRATVIDPNVRMFETRPWIGPMRRIDFIIRMSIETDDNPDPGSADRAQRILRVFERQERINWLGRGNLRVMPVAVNDTIARFL